MNPLPDLPPDRPSRWYVIAPDGTVMSDWHSRELAEAELREIAPAGSWIEED